VVDEGDGELRESSIFRDSDRASLRMATVDFNSDFEFARSVAYFSDAV
jgi:hypothetical protein